MRLTTIIEACAVGLAFALQAAAAPRVSTPALVQVFSNGVVVCPTGAFSSGHASKGEEVRFDFGLPPAPPLRRFLLDNVPILQTEWEHLGIRYVQRVCITRLGDGPLDGAAEDALLVVQIHGESMVQEYTNASASLAVQVGGNFWPLELRGGWIYCPGQQNPHPLAFLDIPSVGVVKTNGLRLEFQGHMPPANTGSMTLFIPRHPITPGNSADRLLDLDVNEILGRVRDYWRRPEAQKLRPPLEWEDQLNPKPIPGTAGR